MEYETMTLRRFPTELEAEMARGCLEAHGVRAIVSHEDEGSIGPIFNLQKGVRLLVFRTDEVEANRILSEQISHDDEE